MNEIFTLKAGACISDVLTGVAWEFDEIRLQVAKRACFLKEFGIKRGQNVLISHGGTPFFLADLFAVWQVGGCATCLNPGLTAGEQKNVESFLKPEMILAGPGSDTDHTYFSRPVADLTTCSPGAEIALGESQLQQHDLALILFTSGTTGKPKGVVHTKKSIAAKLEQNLKNIKTGMLDRTLGVLPTHFVSGLLGGILTTLSAGKKVFLFQQPGIGGAARLGQVIDDYEITFLNSAPSLWKVVLKVSNPPIKHSLRQISVCSAPLDKTTWESIIKWTGTNNVFNMYGATETGGWDIGASSADHDPETGLIGTVWNGEAAILTSGGQRKSSGKGEIVLKSPSLMHGYFRRRNLTGEAIQDGWYRTGDLGHIDDTGLVRFLGRCKSEINRAGNKVSPEEVDMLLEQHQSVKEACAFGLPDPVSGETIGCAVVLKEGCDEEVNALRQWCAERIQPACVPERWYFIKDIPKTAHGKVNREEVARICLGKGD